MKKSILIFTVMLALMISKAFSQSALDVSAGISHQDQFFTNFAYRYQFNDKFRMGIEVQYGVPKYRFVDAKPIRDGYSSTLSVPLTIRLYEKEKIRLDLYTKAGIRFQGILDPDNNDKRDSILNSNAYIFDPGLLVTVKLNEKCNLQSGVTFPLAYQTRPTAIFENIYPGLLHLGINYKPSGNRILFAKTLAGGAVGGNGDTQKFGWSIQAGIRFIMGKKPVSSLIEPSF